jgi:hypothetical protein
MAQAQIQPRNILLLAGNGYQPTSNDRRVEHKLEHGPLICFERELPNGGKRIAALRYSTYDEFAFGKRHPRAILEFMQEHYKISDVLSTNICEIVPSAKKNNHGIVLKPGDLALIDDTLFLFTIMLDGKPIVMKAAAMQRPGERQKTHSLALSTLILAAAGESDPGVRIKSDSIRMSGAIEIPKGFVLPEIRYFQECDIPLITASGVAEADIARALGLEIATIAIGVQNVKPDEQFGSTLKLSKEGTEIGVHKSRIAERILDYAATLWSKIAQ